MNTSLLRKTISEQVDTPPDLLRDTIKSVIAGTTTHYATRKKKEHNKQKKYIEKEILNLLTRKHIGN